MKKQLLIVAAVALLSLNAKAQGFFNFANGAAGVNGGPPVNAPIYEVDGTTKLAGSAYLADYYWGTAGISDPSALTSAGLAVPFSANGIFLGGTQTISGQTGTVTLQVRAWRASDGASYAAAAASGPTAHIGQGNLIQLALATGGNAPTPMVGLQSFNLTTGPEPATIALGLMGAGALFIRRRKA